MQELLEFAVDIAKQAGRLTMGHFRSAGLDVDTKSDDSPVTVADRQAEALLRTLIRDRYPADAIVGEEQDDVPGTSGRTWFLDPIDGTKSFVHGVPLFTNLVACNDPDGPLVGVINAPALGETTWAGRGLGCHHKGDPVRLTSTDVLSDAYVMTSGTEWWPERLRPLLLDPPFTLRTWGDGYGYSLVLTGRVDGMIDPQAEVWDLAPLPILASESGARLTGFDGTQVVGSGSAVLTNGHIHDDLLAVLDV